MVGSALFANAAHLDDYYYYYRDRYYDADLVDNRNDHDYRNDYYDRYPDRNRDYYDDVDNNEDDFGDLDDPRFVSYGQNYLVFVGPNEIILALDSDRLGLNFRNADRGARLHGYDAISTDRDTYPYYNNGNNAAGYYDRYRDLPGYRQIDYDELYPGINARYRGYDDYWQYQFAARAGADPSNIVLDLRGARNVEINANGDLVIYLSDRKIVCPRPTIYQDYRGSTRTVNGGYNLVGDRQVGFNFDGYDGHYPLYIDPLVMRPENLDPGYWRSR